MKNEFQEEGILCWVGPTEQKTETFSVRLFAIDTSYEYQGNKYTQFADFQLMNHQCDLIDGHKIGDKVKVHFAIKGNKAKNDDKFFTKLNAYRIEPIAPAVPPAPAPQQSMPPAQQYQTTPPPAPAPELQYNPGWQQPQQPPYQNWQPPATQPQTDDLPF